MAKRLAALLAVLAAAGIVAACEAAGSPAHAGTNPLVYICQQTPCANSQEFEIFDGSGAPIYSVGEYGGAAVFGDNFSVFAPNEVYNPSLVLSWESPDAYADTFGHSDKCVAPSKWIEPGGTWTCQYGAWKRIGA